MSQLKVFISSTCYDLSQIRANLFDFLVSAGYQPNLSEHMSFPIDPDQNTIENCIQNVNNADIFILIIGNRYGHTVESGKSVTNTEYLFAKQFGLPVYIFIHKPLITLMPIWKNNRNVDFSGSVESVKVFEFVEELRNGNRNWCYDFEFATDIINTLKIQFSHLFKQSLDVRKKYRLSERPDFHTNLSPRALNLILKEDLLYEALFFLNVLVDELDKYEDMKLDLEYRVLVGCKREISDIYQLMSWLSIEFEAVSNLIASFNNVFDGAYFKFYGEPGIESDLKGLYYVASALARIYREMLLWSINVRSTKVDDDFMLLRDTLSNLAVLPTNQVWSFPRIAISDAIKAIDEYKLTGKPITIDAVLNIQIDNDTRDIFSAEMARIKRNFGL